VASGRFSLVLAMEVATSRPAPAVLLVEVRYDDLRHAGARRRRGAGAAVVDHRRHPGKQLGVIAVGGRDHSLGQRAAGEAAMFDRSGFLVPR
jgi:hypothetical protein